MKVQVEYFGPACNWAGAGEDVFEIVEGASLGTLIERMCEVRPALVSRREILRFAVNQVFADDQQVLRDGDEVAVIPPVSGGADDDRIMIVDEPIDRSAVRDHVNGDPAVGGVAVFEGVTRFAEHPQHGELVRLEYESHREMALAQMKKLAEAARRRWGIRRLAMVHRVGPVAIGEPIVIIAVACGHRGEAFDACRFLIDTLKKEVSIWKKEVWAGGETTWVDPTD
ncbi:MAG: molybdenum cofactor biosynthesis protein MoaE [Phycisphaerae bacterium]